MASINESYDKTGDLEDTEMNEKEKKDITSKHYSYDDAVALTEQLNKMSTNEAYTVSEEDFEGNTKNENSEKVTTWILSCSKTNEKSYTYDEAISLAGNGRYNICLLTSVSVAIIAMGIDMFGFSVIVNGCSCEFNLDLSQKSIMLSMPFLGPILMAYPWGYISDTRGRKLSLHVAYWGSFFLSTISAFSPNWIVLAVLRFMSTSLGSCGQSSTYTLLGESCGVKVRGAYMLIMTSVLNFAFASYMTIAFIVLNLDISYDWGFMTFTQWRLLVIVLAMPLGIAAVSLHFFYESPKFLVNAGYEKLALKILRKTWARNGGEVNKYPVEKVILNEDGNIRNKDVPLLKSLWNQTVPLFKPPLLLRTIKLFYITTVVYTISSGFFIWFPFLVQSLVRALSSPDSVEQEQGLCNMITSPQITNVTSVTTDITVECSTKMDPIIVYSALAEGFVFISTNLAISRLSSRKKALMIAILLTSAVTSFGAVTVSNNIVSFILFFGLLFTAMAMGVVSSYYVDLYPTSYRGMASCLGVMIARISGLAGVNIIGSYIISNCVVTFYSCTAFVISGVIMACFLPPDKP